MVQRLHCSALRLLLAVLLSLSLCPLAVPPAMATRPQAQSGDLVDLVLNYGLGVARLYTMRATAPLGQWQRAVLNLSPWAGLRVKLVFLAQTNATAPTLFRLDDVSVRVCLGTRLLYLPLLLRT